MDFVLLIFEELILNTGFSGSSVLKNPPANTGDSGSISGLGRSPKEGNGNFLQYSRLGNAMDRGACELQPIESKRSGHSWTHTHILYYIHFPIFVFAWRLSAFLPICHTLADEKHSFRSLYFIHEASPGSTPSSFPSDPPHPSPRMAVTVSSSSFHFLSLLQSISSTNAS